MKQILQWLLVLAFVVTGGWVAVKKGSLRLKPWQVPEGTAGEVVKAVNLARKARNHEPLKRSEELDQWVRTQMGAFAPTDSGIELILARLQDSMPAVVQASARYLEARDEKGLIENMKKWGDGAELPGLTHVAVHFFRNKGRSRYRAMVLATRIVPMFSTDLLSPDRLGETEYYNICRNCDRSHRGIAARSSLGGIPLVCPHCEKEYDVYAMRLDGRFVRITELLSGFEPPAVFSGEMSKYEEMMAIWGAVLDNFVYIEDLVSERGRQDSWQTAKETCIYKNGDCEDTSIFMTDWLLARGIEARVAFGLDHTGGGHAWVVARINGEEYLLESTNGESDPGDPPLVSKIGHLYRPLAMFDRTSIWYRKGKGWTPRYFADSQWRRIDYERPAIGLAQRDITEILRDGLAGAAVPR